MRRASLTDRGRDAMRTRMVIAAGLALHGLVHLLGVVVY
jgi:hypothetical protein